MTFSEALECLKNDEMVYRTGWNGKDMYIFLVDERKQDIPTKIKYLPYLEMFTATGGNVPWLASQIDILAEDWEYITE